MDCFFFKSENELILREAKYTQLVHYFSSFEGIGFLVQGSTDSGNKLWQNPFTEIYDFHNEVIC